MTSLNFGIYLIAIFLNNNFIVVKNNLFNLY